MDAKLATILLACLIFVLNWYKDDIRAFFKYLYRLYKDWKDPLRRYCETIRWEDFTRVGTTHTCISSVWYSPVACVDCHQALNHEHKPEKSCWLHTISLVFNSIWNDPEREAKLVKPAGLSLERSYICVDAKVIRAYILCTARVTRFEEEMLGQSRRYVKFDSREDRLTVAHLGPPDRLLHTELSAEEINLILKGWPPFYRKELRTPEDHVLIHPIRDDEDIRRPGWIVAVGLALNQPTDLCIANVLMQEATDRFVYVMEKKLQPKFRFDEAFKEKLSILKSVKAGKEPLSLNVASYLTEENKELKPAAKLATHTIQYPRTIADAKLTREECQTVLQVFQDMEITPKQAQLLGENLPAVLDRAIMGFRAVKEYFKTNRVMVVPRPLLGDQVVYLTDCHKSLT